VDLSLLTQNEKWESGFQDRILTLMIDDDPDDGGTLHSSLSFVHEKDGEKIMVGCVLPARVPPYYSSGLLLGGVVKLCSSGQRCEN